MPAALLSSFLPHLPRPGASLFENLDSAAYRAEQAIADVTRARVLAAYCALVYPTFWALDCIAYPSLANQFLLIRLVVVAVGLMVLLQSYSRHRAHAVHSARFLGFVATLGVVVMCALAEGFHSNYLVGIIVCLLAVTTIELYRPRGLLITLVAVFAAYGLANAYAHPHSGLPTIVSSCAFLCGSSLFCLVAAVLLENQRRRLYKLQLELTERNVALERAQGHQREFLRTVTHELRTPINSVMGFIDLIEEEDAHLSGPTRTRLKRMGTASQRLLGVVNDILDLSRIEAGKLEINAAPCDISQLALEVADETRALIRARPVEVLVECPADLCWTTDGKRVRQILVNLAGNAAKFTPEGTIRIEARVQDAKLHIAVKDSGVGMSEADLEHVLEPFAQAAQGKLAGGTGLGLSIAKKLVELLGGTLTVDSELRAGTTFRLTLLEGKSSIPDVNPQLADEAYRG